MTEPFELTTTEAAAAIAARDLSPVDLLESLVARSEALDGSLHAWVRLDLDRARAEARACASEAAQGRLRGPLHGVPFGVKDIYFTQRLITEAGSALYQGFVPAYDATTVARLRAAGAIVLGKTETTQFAAGDPAPTRNPWNLEHTPGGSSSGSAAAVAARLVPFALGTQTGGSVLRPAAFCGLAGFKPSTGRYSLDGIIPLARSLDHAGTLTRTVADARLLYTVLDERGDAGVAPAMAGPPQLVVLEGSFIDRASADARAQLDRTIEALVRAGASARTAPDRGLAAMVDVHHVIMAAEAAAYHAADYARRPEAYRPNLRTLIEAGSLVPATAFLRAQALRSWNPEALADGFIVMPSALGAAPVTLASTGDPAFNAPWSLTGLPAISIPCGLSPDGLPYGLQLVGRMWQDLQLLDAAEWCERVLGPLPLPAGIARLAG